MAHRQKITLGDSLAPVDNRNFTHRLRNAFYSLLKLSLLTAISALGLWWLLRHPAMNLDMTLLFILVFVFGLAGLWGLLQPRHKRPKTHYLLANDRGGFMRNLRLDAKTVILDGSNLYHFGHDNGLDAQPLGEIAHNLREQGYRVVSFFDANIFHTLGEHGAFPISQRHSLDLLTDVFGLAPDEIYVVPSGVQADKYILETLKYLPISFAVSNDRFRDYAANYPTVMKDSHWRKGVVISKNEIRLLNHRFPDPIVVQAGRRHG